MYVMRLDSDQCLAHSSYYKNSLRGNSLKGRIETILLYPNHSKAAIQALLRPSDRKTESPNLTTNSSNKVITYYRFLVHFYRCVTS